MRQSHSKSNYTRRQTIRIISLGLTSLSLPIGFTTCGTKHPKKRHIVTLSFDDGFLKSKIDDLLSRPSGWLIYNTHGLDKEGWGPLSSDYLDDLLKQLTSLDSVAVLPTGQALSNLI